MNFRHIILPALLLASAQHIAAQNSVTISNDAVEQSFEYLRGNKYQKDYLLFMNMLQESHPAFETQAPFDVRKETERGYKLLKNCTERENFIIELQRTAAKVHDAHTLVSDFFKGDTAYPFNCLIDDRECRLTAAEKDASPSLHKPITHINGKELSAVLTRFRELFSSDNEAGFRKTFRNTAPMFRLWQQAGLCDADSSLTLTFADNSTLKLHPVPIKQISLQNKTPKRLTPTQQMRMRHRGMPFAFEIAKPGVCFMLFDLCEDRNTLRMKHLAQVTGNEALRARLEQQLQRIPVFTEFLDSMFRTMQNSAVHTLVIDVRENGGGNSTLCNELLCRLKSTVKGYRCHIRRSRLADAFYRNADTDISGWNFRDTLSNDMSGSSLPFSGRVIWIQGERTFSSAGMLITMAADNGIGTVVGTQGSYTPNHYGDVIPWTLPNTRVQGTVSHKVWLRPDAEKDNSIRLFQEFPVSLDDIAEGIDPCWDWAVNH